MIEILNQLTRLNRNLRLDDDLEGFTISPTLRNEHTELLAQVTANKDRLLALLLDSNTLVTAIEKWAGDSPKKWQQALTKFRKNYNPNPYIWDAYDHLISWLNANQHIYSASVQIKKLQKRKNKSNSDTISMNARYADTSAYKRLSVIHREKLVTSLLSHADLYGQIDRYMGRHETKKEKVASK
jgi:hypothetical protein